MDGGKSAARVWDRSGATCRGDGRGWLIDCGRSWVNWGGGVVVVVRGLARGMSLLRPFRFQPYDTALNKVQ